MASCSRLAPGEACFSLRLRCSVHLGLFPTNTAYFTYGGMCFRASDVLPWGCPTSSCVDLEAQRTGLLLEGGTVPDSLRFSSTR